MFVCLFVFTGCNSNEVIQLSGISGYITSPNHPNRYPANQKCTWNITAPLGYSSIRLKFLLVNLEADCCRCDKVTVQNGPSSTSPFLMFVCGRYVSYPRISSGRNVWIEFKSNHKDQFSGFKLFYSAILEIPSEYICSGLFG